MKIVQIEYNYDWIVSLYMFNVYNFYPIFICMIFIWFDLICIITNIFLYFLEYLDNAECLNFVSNNIHKYCNVDAYKKYVSQEARCL